MNDIHDDLREVMGLLGKATLGPWECGRGGKYEPATSVYCDDALGSIVATCAHSTNVLVTRESEAANAALIAASVNFLRQHGPALLAAAKYEGANPLGGPATMLEAAARRIRAGEDFHEVLADYGLLARQDGEDWLPIESAPEDGTVIWVIQQAWWGIWQYECKWEYGAWYHGYGDAWPAADPTHWRPLPAPPAARSGGGG